MPVQIPKIDRFDTQAPQSAGRLEINAPNLLGATEPLREGVNSAVTGTVDAYQKVQEKIRKKDLETKDLKALEYAVKYESVLKNGLTEIEQMKGDTTYYYKEFDKKQEETESKIYDEVTDPETQAFLKEKIIKANGRISDTRTTQQTKQYYQWQNDVTNSAVKLRQDNAMKSSEALNAANWTGTVGPVKNQLNEIETARIAIARQNGYNIPVTTYENGSRVVDYSEAPMIEAQIKADIGDAVIPMVKALNNAGKVKEAKLLIEDQQKWLNAKDYATLTADNDDANVKTQALALISTLQNKSGKAAFDEIAKKDTTDSIKFKARELVDTLDRQNENTKMRKAKEADNFLYTHVDDKQRSEQPYATISEFKDSPQYKEYKDVLSAQDLKALEQRIEAPPTSDPVARDKISDVWRENQFENMSTTDFNKLLKGLDKQDRDKYTKLRESVTKPPKGMTEAESRARANAVNEYFMTDAISSGLIPKSNKDKWSQADATYYSEKLEPAWINYYNKNISDKPGLIEATTQKALVRDFIRDFTSKAENAPPRKSFFGFSYGGRDLQKLPELARGAKVPNSPMRSNQDETTALGPKTTVTPKDAKPANSAVDLGNMSRAQYQYWEDEYIKEHGAGSLLPDDPAEFQAWINKKVKK